MISATLIHIGMTACFCLVYQFDSLCIYGKCDSFRCQVTSRLAYAHNNRIRVSGLAALFSCHVQLWSIEFVTQIDNQGKILYLFWPRSDVTWTNCYISITIFLTVCSDGALFFSLGPNSSNPGNSRY